MSARGLTAGRRRADAGRLARITARDLNRQITLQSVTRTPDGAGRYTEALTAEATVWAHVEPLTGREQILAMQTDMERPYRFTIRYRESVTGATRIAYDGRAFDVKSVVDTEERHRELVIMAEEVA